MKNEIFYVLMDKRNLTYHIENGYTTDDVMQAMQFNTDKIALKYLLEEIDEDVQEEFEIYKIDMNVYFELVKKENIQ